MRHKLSKESENTDRWLVSYADFITLLFAFFVVMYSVSQVNEGKFKILSETLTDAFVQPERSLQPIQVGEVNKADTITSGDATYPTDYFDEPATPEADQVFEDLREDIAATFKELIEEDVVRIRSNQSSIHLEFTQDGMFESGDSKISNSFMPAILTIVDKYKDKPNAIKIRGYTDNRPIGTSKFPSNWELSAARAASFARLLEENGILGSRLMVEGYGEHQPVDSNDEDEGRKANRRLVVVYSRYPPPISPLEQEAQDEAKVRANNRGLVPIQNSADSEDEPEINLVRAPDGSLIIRGRNNDDADNTDNQQ